MSKPRLDGKVAVVTGGASGIGEQAVRLFAKNGASVVALDIQDELGKQVVASIGSEKVSYYRCNVTEEKQVEEAVNFAVEKYGRLDILFSCAAIVGSLSGILEFEQEDFDKTMAVNVRGVAFTVKHAGRVMVEKKIRGSIICMGSLSTNLAGLGPLCYTMSKHAVLGLVKTACEELGGYGIKVNSISPMGMATPLVCEAFKYPSDGLEKIGQAMASLKGIVLKPKHVAEVALFLASDESAYISGHNLVVDGGHTVVSRPGYFASSSDDDDD